MIKMILADFGPQTETLLKTYLKKDHHIMDWIRLCGQWHGLYSYTMTLNSKFNNFRGHYLVKKDIKSDPPSNVHLKGIDFYHPILNMNKTIKDGDIAP